MERIRLHSSHYEFIFPYRPDIESLNEFLVRGTGDVIQGFSKGYQLTQRESEIVFLIAIHGFSNQEISDYCKISEKTVKNHIANIMSKMGIRSIRKLLSLLFNHVLNTCE
jgi:DNA-binding CsgD family transcriptional regulator